MADEPIEVVVLADGAGNYYLFSRESVEQARVPAELMADIDQMIGDDDVAGFVWPIPIPKESNSLQLRFVTLGEVRSPSVFMNLQTLR